MSDETEMDQLPQFSSGFSGVHELVSSLRLMENEVPHLILGPAEPRCEDLPDLRSTVKLKSFRIPLSYYPKVIMVFNMFLLIL